jgi:hypothetical protein
VGYFGTVNILRSQNSKPYTCLKSQINDKISKPECHKGPTTDQQEMLTSACFLFNYTLDLSVADHHKRNRNTQTRNYPDSCVNVRLPLQTERKLAFKKVKFEVWIVCLVSNDSLQRVISIREGCCGLWSVSKNSNWVELVLFIHILKEKLTVKRFVPIFKYSLV